MNRVVTRRAAPIVPGGLAIAALLLALLSWSPGDIHAQSLSVSKKVYGDWVVTCSDGRCFAGHRAGPLSIVIGHSARTGALRAALVLGNDATLGAPVSVLLNTNVMIELLVTGCEKKSCEAAVEATKTRLVTDAFKRAGSGVVAYQAGKRIRILRFSLRGSNAAIGAVGG
jgi:hypothetical protein